MAWLLPEDAYCALIEARDQMRLLAKLAAPRVALEPEEVPFSTTALSQCFDRVAGELDVVVQTAKFRGFGKSTSGVGRGRFARKPQSLRAPEPRR